MPCGRRVFFAFAGLGAFFYLICGAVAEKSFKKNKILFDKNGQKRLNGVLIF